MSNSDSHTGPVNEAPVRIKGIFSAVIDQDSTSTAPPTKRSNLWFGKSIDADTIILQKLDQYFAPTKTQVVKKRDELFREFVLEPEIGYKLLTQRVVKGDFYRKQRMDAEAQIEYQQALKIDEENIRAMFGLGLVYLSMNQKEKGKYIFQRLVELDESFETQHKHLFNEFGIGLRKQKLYSEALTYYGRAFKLSPDDENLCLNMARAYYEKGDIAATYKYLKKACEINPELTQAKAFVAYLKKTGHIPDDPEIAEFFGIGTASVRRPRPRKKRLY